MKRLQCLAIVAAFISLAAGCGLLGRVQGSGNVISENRNVSGFDSVSLTGNGELQLDQNGTESLSITADDNILPMLTSEVEGTQLILRVKTGVNVSPSRRIVFKVGARNLIGISCAGDTSAAAKGIHTDALKLVMAGSGDISAEGQSERQDITIAGSGTYQGSGLKTKFTTISVAGSGKATLAVSDKLEVSIVGDGTIKYIGDPTVKQSVLGSGSISKQ